MTSCSRSVVIVYINSARRRLLERHTDIHNGLPSDAAFSQRKACVKGKVEFGGKVGSAGKLQAGTVIAQISHDTTHRRAVGRNDLGALEYLSSWKPPTIEHVSTKPQFLQTISRPNLFQNRKWDGFQRVKLRQPYDFGRQLVVARALAAVSSRRSKPDRRSLPDRLSPWDRFSASDRVSTPQRRSCSLCLQSMKGSGCRQSKQWLAARLWHLGEFRSSTRLLVGTHAASIRWTLKDGTKQ